MASVTRVVATAITCVIALTRDRQKQPTLNATAATAKAIARRHARRQTRTSKAEVKAGEDGRPKVAAAKVGEKAVEKVRAKAEKEKAKENYMNSTPHSSHRDCQDSSGRAPKVRGEEDKKIPGMGIGTHGEEVAGINTG